MSLQTLPQLLEHWAQCCPERVWLKDLTPDGAREYAWGAARDEVNAAASALEGRFGHGCRMVLLSRNRAHWFMADLAVIASGNISIGMFTTLPPGTARYVLDFAEARVMFVGEAPNWDKVRKILPDGITLVSLPGVELEEPHLRWEDLVAEGRGSRAHFQPRPDDVMSLVFTSGTTGQPKGVIQTHQSNLLPIRRFREAFGTRDRARHFSY